MKKYTPNFKRLDELAEEGYLRKVISPCNKLMLYNYTDKCTYEKKWNKHTLASRGTVYEIATGKIVATAFPKFFNFKELQPVVQKTLIKKTKFTVCEKMDGSLGIVYFYDGKWNVNTRGSFTSDQAIKAQEMLKGHYTVNMNPNITYLVEIIYPENRIIVDYGMEEKLTLLAGFNNVTGEDISLEELSQTSSFFEADVYHDFKSIQEVVEEQARLGKMEEGFVVVFEDGYRCKFKSAEYLKVARLLSEMTPLNFWKAMKDGVVQQEILEEIPEEFDDEVKRIKKFLEFKYRDVRDEIAIDYKYCIESIGGLYNVDEDRKKLGLFVKEHGSELEYPAAMFAMLLGQSVDKYIMKEIRPVGNKI